MYSRKYAKVCNGKRGQFFHCTHVAVLKLGGNDFTDLLTCFNAKCDIIILWFYKNIISASIKKYFNNCSH